MLHSQSAEDVLKNLVVIEDFIPDRVCDELVAAHRYLLSPTEQSDNGLYVPKLKDAYPALFWTVRIIIQSVIWVIQEHFDDSVGCDLAMVCAITGSFRHTTHADNCYVSCPRHGNNAEQLMAFNCWCNDIEVKPNHTFWRKHTALMYLDNDHEGGNIVFGEGPNVFGRIYRKEIITKRGLLVLSPSNELYHHRTTPVVRGTRYSLNTWFTADKHRICQSLM
jgi:hypothetical protein